MLLELGDEAAEKRHGVDLRLVSQPHTAGEWKGDVRIVDPLGTLEFGFSRCGQNVLGGVDTLRCLRVRVIVFALDVQTVFLAVPQQPVAALRVPDDVVAQYFSSMFGS